MSAPAAHIRVADYEGNIVYFATRRGSEFDQSSRGIRRYDVATEQFLEWIELPFTPTWMAVEDGHIYVADSEALYVLEQGNQELRELYRPALEYRDSISGIEADGDLIFILIGDYWNDAKYVIFNTSTGTAATVTQYGTGVQMLVAKSLNKLIIKATGSLGKPISVAYNTAGELGDFTDHEATTMNDVSRFFLSPDESRLVENGGAYRETGQFEVIGSLDDAFDRCAFWNGRPVVTVDEQLKIYDGNWLPVATHALEFEPEALHVQSGILYYFTAIYDDIDEDAIRVRKVSLSDLSPELEPAPDPKTLDYEPDLVVAGNQDLFLIDGETQSLFIWSLTDYEYSGAINLAGAPTAASASPDGSKLYYAMGTNLLRVVELATGQDRPVHSFTETPINLVWIDGQLVVLGYTRAWVLNSAGEISHEMELESGTYRAAHWAPETRDLHLASPYSYYIADVGEDLDLIFDRWNPERDIDTSNATYIHFFIEDPVRMVDANGQIWQAGHEGAVGSLPNRLLGVVPAETGCFLTLFRHNDGGQTPDLDFTLVQKWNRNVEQIGTIALPGRPSHIVATGTGEVACVTMVGKKPAVHLLDQDLSPFFSSTTENSLHVSRRPDGSFLIEWNSQGKFYTDIVFEHLASDGYWKELARAPESQGWCVASSASIAGDNLLVRAYYPTHDQLEPFEIESITCELYITHPSGETIFLQRRDGEGEWQDEERLDRREGSWIRRPDPTTTEYRVVRRHYQYGEALETHQGDWIREFNWLPMRDVSYGLYEKNGVEWELIASFPSDQTSYEHRSSAPEAPEVVVVGVHDMNPESIHTVEGGLFRQISWTASTEASGGYFLEFGDWPTVIVTDTAFRLPVIFLDDHTVLPIIETTDEEDASTAFELEVTLRWADAYGHNGFYLMSRTDPAKPWTVLAQKEFAARRHTFSIPSQNLPELALYKSEKIYTTSPFATGVYLHYAAEDNILGSRRVNGDGVRWSRWTGYYYWTPEFDNWHYSWDTGWCYTALVEPTGGWLWDETLGWTFTNPLSPGWSYQASPARWLFRYFGTRWAYDSAAQKYIWL